MIAHYPLHTELSIYVWKLSNKTWSLKCSAWKGFAQSLVFEKNLDDVVLRHENDKFSMVSRWWEVLKWILYWFCIDDRKLPWKNYVNFDEWSSGHLDHPWCSPATSLAAFYLSLLDLRGTGCVGSWDCGSCHTVSREVVWSSAPFISSSCGQGWILVDVFLMHRPRVNMELQGGKMGYQWKLLMLAFVKCWGSVVIPMWSYVGTGQVKLG